MGRNCAKSFQYIAAGLLILAPNLGEAVSRKPSAPTGLVATLVSSSQVRLRWTDRSGNETGFTVNRTKLQTNGTYASSVNYTVAANTIEFLNSPGPGTFRYKVRAFNTSGASNFSSYAQVSLVAGTPTPGPTATPTSSPTATYTATPTPTPSATPTTSGSTTLLLPGPGFPTLTAQPAPIGNSSSRGYDALPAARWDVVPNQRVRDQINIGVVAFHVNGIDRIEISANGGTPAIIRNMTLNPETNVVEYWATLRASDFNDGRVELRATVFPRTAGQVRVLQGDHVTQVQNPNPNIACQANPDGSGMYINDGQPDERSLFIYTNSHGTLRNTGLEVWADSRVGSDSNDGSFLRPFATIGRAASYLSANASSGILDGAIIKLKAGTYAFPSTWFFTKESYVTITSDPAANPADVIVQSGAQNLVFNYLRFSRLVLRSRAVDSFFFGLNSCWTANPNLWLDDVSVVGSYCIPTVSNPTTCDALQGISNGSALRITNSRWDHIADGPKGAAFIRGIVATNLAGVVFQNSGFIVNALVDRVERGLVDIGIHTDLYQQYTPGRTLDNVILYNIRGTNLQSIGLNIGSLSNSAIVNYLADKGPFVGSAYPESNQIAPNHSHLLLWHVSLLGSGAVWYVDPNNFHPHLIDIQGGLIAAMSGGIPDPNSGYWTGSPLAGSLVTGSPEIRFGSMHYMSNGGYGGFIPGSDVTVGDPMLGGDDRPLAGSVLKNRLQTVIVPRDAAGEVRTQTPSIGAFE